MESIIPSRSAHPLLRLRKWCLALAVGLAVLLPVSGAFADLESQEKIDEAVAEYTEATTQARDNIPGNAGVKRAEDALDAAGRAKMDAEDKLEAAKKDANPTNAKRAQETVATAEAAETAAQTAADDARKSAKETDTEKERADKYREALANRRAARRTMLALLPELKQLVGTRRHNLVDVKEVEDAMRFLRTRIGRSEKPITIQSVAALMPFLPMTANVSTDSQKNCTFGKAGPLAHFFEPADGEGNPLDTSLPDGVIGLAPGPININNPDPDAQKPKKKEGGAANAAADGPQNAGSSGKQVPDKTAAASVPAASKAAAPNSLDMLGGSILDQIEPTPQRPADSGLLAKLPNGQLPEDELDRLTKLAEQALARGDRAAFESYREEARAVTNWVVTNIFRGSDVFSKFGMAGVRVGFTDTPEGNALRFRYESEVPKFREWWTYHTKVAFWGGNPSSIPGSEEESESAARIGKPQPEKPVKAAPASGAAAASPTVAPPAAGTVDQKEKSKATSPADPPSQPAVPGSKSAQAIEKMNQKGEPADKTPSSATSADPEVAARNITIYFKVEESVLKGGAQGDEIKEGQLAKLTAEEPELPKTGRTRTAKTQVDKGYDKSPVMCATDGGRCKAQVPADERDSYGLSVLPPAAASRDKMGSNADLMREFVRTHGGLDSDNYRVELMPAHTTGVVLNKTAAALTPKQRAALADAPSGVMVSKADFKVGGKSYTRIGITGPPAIVAQLAKPHTNI